MVNLEFELTKVLAYQGKLTVAIAIRNVALCEHCAISSSNWMIFFILATVMYFQLVRFVA